MTETNCWPHIAWEFATTVDNNVLIRSGEAPAIGWSRNTLYSGFNILPRSVVRRQTGFAARITRTLSRLRERHDT